MNYIDNTDATFVSLAKELNLTPSSINRWYHGICIPDINLLPDLCKILNISIMELIGADNNSSLTEQQNNLLQSYIQDEYFKALVNRYHDDKEFQAVIKYFFDHSK